MMEHRLPQREEIAVRRVEDLDTIHKTRKSKHAAVGSHRNPNESLA